MTGCSADYCTNSSQKGFQMCKLPTETKRRKIWVEKINRTDWVPGPGAALCHIHFEESMWERCNAGKRRLKRDAIPTLFISSTQSTSNVQLRENDEINCASTSKDDNSGQCSDNRNIPSPVISSVDEIDEITSDICVSENNENSQDARHRNDNEIEDIRKRLAILEKLYSNSEQSRISLKRKLDAATKKIKRLEKRVSQLNAQEAISKIFNQDQIKKLSNFYKKVPNWCSDTIIKALKLRFACGTSGYEELLKQNLPLPSIRTLTRKLENMKLGSGICCDILKFLSIKVTHFTNEIDKDCVLLLDEMSIKSGRFYDVATHSFIGNVSLPKHDQEKVATHGLVFMLAGLSSRWKQAVALYFTGDSTNGSVLKDICTEIIIKAERIGLRVHVITSDMGAPNQAMWRKFGINASRFSVTINSCAHPVRIEDKLYFNADTPHAFKNIKAGFISNEYIEIPSGFVEKYNLPSNKVNAVHLYDIINEDESLELKLAPKLQKEMLDSQNHFLKMRVSASTRVFSEDVSTALEFLTNNDCNDERLTTAWFISMVARWFSIMSSRNINLAFSKNNIDAYNENIEFLNEFMELFATIKVGFKGAWKPFQTAVLISTTTVLQLTEELLNLRNFMFFFPCRLNQDCLENLFSVMRLRNATPNALQFKNNLKLIIVSQFMKTISNSNYDDDDRTFLSDFLNILLENRCQNTHFLRDNDHSTIPNIQNCYITFGRTEKNVIYHVAGYIIASIVRTQKTCKKCIMATRTHKIMYYQYNELTRLRAKHSGRVFVNNATFRFFMQMETVFRNYYKHVKNLKINLRNFFITKFKEIEYTLPECHNLKTKIALRYLTFRLKVSSKKYDVKKNRFYSSKTMAMHENVR